MMIKLENIKKTYGKNENLQTVLSDVSLEIEKGSMVSVMGPSGSGKTSLLNIIGMLDNQYEGTYLLDGKEVLSESDEGKSVLRNEKIGFIFQEFNLINELTVKENVKLSLVFANIYRKKKDRYRKGEMEQMCRKMLGMVGLEKHMDKKPGQLSGGQKQRTAIARAMVGNPDIILADEPTGALDQKTGQEIMECMKLLNRQGKTIIIVTHDKNIANQCGQQIMIMDGRIIS